jgi:hypothetical protein
MSEEKNYVLGFIAICVSAVVNFILKFVLALNVTIMLWGDEGFNSVPVVIEASFLLLFMVQLFILRFIFKNRFGINIFGIVIFLVIPLILCSDNVQSVPYMELLAILQACACKLIFDFEKVVGLFHKKQN